MKLARALGELVAQLDAHGVAYAVVGGLAASARGEARFTRDIDVAIMVDNDVAIMVDNDEEAELSIYNLVQEGYVVIATVEQEATHWAISWEMGHHGDGRIHGCDEDPLCHHQTSP